MNYLIYYLLIGVGLTFVLLVADTVMGRKASGLDVFLCIVLWPGIVVVNILYYGGYIEMKDDS